MQSFIPSHCKSYEGAGMREFMLECLCCACQVIHSLHDTPECLRAGSLILCTVTFITGIIRFACAFTHNGLTDN